MKDLTYFTLGNVMKRINNINIDINLSHTKPFPKPKEQLLSIQVVAFCLAPFDPEL